jgi:dihydroxyacid dehydratase/phosphogluconate dehydratase
LRWAARPLGAALIAIAHELAKFDLNDLIGLAENSPSCELSPASNYHIEDLYYSGGIGAIMHELDSLGLLKTNAMTDRTT